MRNFIAIVVVALLFNHAQAAYPVYNDLLELNSLLTRERRAIKSTCYDYNSCCDMSNAHKTDSMAECIQQLQIQGRPNPEQIKCIADCMSKKNKYMDENGIIDKEQLRVFLKERLSAYSDWLTDGHINTVVNTCVDSIDASKVPENTCNGVAMTIGHCTAAKMQLYCPEERQKDHEQCKVLQEYIVQNKNLPPSSERC